MQPEPWEPYHPIEPWVVFPVSNVEKAAAPHFKSRPTGLNLGEIQDLFYQADVPIEKSRSRESGDTNAPGLLLAVVLSLLLTAIMANLREPPSYDESLGTVAAGQGGAADEAGKEAQYPSDDEAGGEGGGALLDTPPPPSSDAGPSVLADIARPTVSLWWEPGGGFGGHVCCCSAPPHLPSFPNPPVYH